MGVSPSSYRFLQNGGQNLEENSPLCRYMKNLNGSGRDSLSPFLADSENKMRCLFLQDYAPVRSSLEALKHEVIGVPQFSTIEAAVQTLPWKPDVVFTFFPEFNSLPVDYLNTPVPVIPVVLDYQVNFQSLALAAPFFPKVIVNGKDVAPFLQESGSALVMWHPFVDMDSPPLHLSKNDRSIDVIFVGQVDQVSFQERARSVESILNLLPRYNIKILGKIAYQEALALYRDSKIVFNHAVRPDVLNQRTLDALACGSLLFINEENDATLSWLSVGTDVVAYDDDNLISLLTHYLEHPEERMLMAEKGQEKLRQYRSSKHTFEKRLDEFLNGDANKPDVTEQSKIELFSTGLFYVPTPGLQFHSGGSPNLLNNLGVAYWSCSSVLPHGSSPQLAYRRLAMQYFEKALETDAELLPVHWNLGRAFYFSQGLEKAEYHLNKARELARNHHPWPFSFRSICQAGISDEFTIRFSQFFIEEKLYGKRNDAELNATVLDGIYPLLIELARFTNQSSLATRLVSDWDGADPRPNPTRALIQSELTGTTDPRKSLNQLAQHFLEWPFFHPLSSFKQTAWKLWNQGMREPSKRMVLHLLRRHLAASWKSQNGETKISEMLARIEMQEVDVETFSLLEDIPSFHDFVKTFI